MRRRPNKKSHRVSVTVWVLLAVAIVCMVIAAVGPSAYTNWRMLGDTTLKVGVEVVEPGRIGFSLGSDDLWFGKVPRGGGASRSASIDSPVRASATLTASGEIAPWMAIIPATLTLEAGHARNVTFDINIPEDMEPRNYTGDIHITYRRLLPWE